MTSTTYFLGREKEINAILNALDHSSATSPYFLLIQGESGLGKTMLLNHLVETVIPKSAPNSIVISPIDFYTSDYHEISTFLDGLVSRLQQTSSHQEQIFGRYHTTRTNLDSQLLRGTALANSDYIILSEAFWSDYENLVSENQSVLLLMDTFERVEDGAIGNWLIQYGKRFNNTLLIIAGRHFEHFYQRLQLQFSNNQYKTLILSGLDDESSRQLIHAHLEDIAPAVPADLVDKWIILSENHPILLALTAISHRSSVYHGHPPAGDLLTKDWSIAKLKSLTGFVNRSTEDDLADLRDLHNKFEARLTRYITKLPKFQRSSVRQMAYTYKRWNRGILAYMISDPLKEEELNELTSQIQSLPYVRTLPSSDDFVLHDRMREMILQHIWESEDPHREINRQLCSKLAIFYQQVLLVSQADQTKDLQKDRLQLLQEHGTESIDQNITAIQKQFRVILEHAQSLEAEWLYYQIMADWKIGLALYHRLAEDDLWANNQAALRVRESERRSAFNDLLQQRVLSLKEFQTLNKLETAFDNCLKAIFPFPTEEKDNNLFELERLLKTLEPTLDSRLYELDFLYLSAVSQSFTKGDEQAERDLKQVIERVKLLKSDESLNRHAGFEYYCYHLMAEAHNRHGVLLRKLGRWEEARESYNNALSAIQPLKWLWQIYRKVAFILNNQAYVESLLGEHDQAERWNQKALDLWERLTGREPSEGRGLALNTRGLILIGKGEYAAGIDYCESAKSQFAELRQKDESEADITKNTNLKEIERGLGLAWLALGEGYRHWALEENTKRGLTSEQLSKKTDKLFLQAQNALENSREILQQTGEPDLAKTYTEWGRLCRDWASLREHQPSEVVPHTMELWEQAKDYLEKAFSIYESRQAETLSIEILLTQARLAIQHGELSPANEYLTQAGIRLERLTVGQEKPTTEHQLLRGMLNHYKGWWYQQLREVKNAYHHWLQGHLDFVPSLHKHAAYMRLHSMLNADLMKQPVGVLQEIEQLVNNFASERKDVAQQAWYRDLRQCIADLLKDRQLDALLA